MKRQERSAGIEMRFRVATLIWAAIFLSVILYGLISFLIPFRPMEGMSGFLPALILGALALLTLGWQRFCLRLRSDARIFSTTLIPPASSGREPGPATAALPSAGDGGPQIIFNAYLSSGIILWALGESMAIYGLVLTVLSGKPAYFCGFGLLACADLLY